MFNCFVVYLGIRQVAIFGTEIAAENFIHIMNERCCPPSQFVIVGAYIPEVGF